MPARSDLCAPYPLKGSTKRSPRSPDCSLLRSLSSFLTHFYCKDKMIWYAMGITTVIFYFIVRAQLRRMPIDMDCTSDSDSGGGNGTQARQGPVCTLLKSNFRPEPDAASYTMFESKKSADFVFFAHLLQCLSRKNAQSSPSREFQPISAKLKSNFPF